MQAHEQLRERVEQQVERRGEDGTRQHEPVRQRVLEVAREQHRLVARAALADDADRLDRRQTELCERAQQPVLALREARRQLLQRVERAVVVDEADDVPADAARDVDEPRRLPLLERLAPRQVEEVGMSGARDELERHEILQPMRGAIAAGHPVTAEVGARVLAEGGNAVDAAVAAGFASWIAESPLTGPGGGGFMLVHRARDRSTRVLDFFVTVPSGGVDVEAMETADVPFDSETTQLFLVGPAAAAVPGAPAGLEHAHRRFGSLPWRDLVAPAIDLARDGVEVTPTQAYLHEILRAIIGPRPGAGERLRFVDLAVDARTDRRRGDGVSLHR